MITQARPLHIMKDSSFPICACYRCHKPLPIRPKRPAGYMIKWFVLEGTVTCFWGYSWGNLIPSPTQRTHEEGTWDNVLSALWAQFPCPGTKLLCKLLAFVITHYTSQTVPFDGPFCLLSAVPGPWTMGLAVPGKAAQKGCYGTGMRNSPYCLTEEALNHAESSKWSYPVALGSPCHLLVPRAVLKETQGSSGGICW